MDAHSESIMQEYKENYATYEKMQEIVMRELNGSLKKANVFVSGTESRIKSEKSLMGKLELKGIKYRTVSDITDILGARVITFYSDEVDAVAALIEKTFTVDRENSVDKRKLYGEDRLGYMSLHYVCKIPESLYKSEEYPLLNELRFEIQIKTALQHVWASINHDMGYKSDVEIPTGYSRRMFRLAGLLEIADEEFKNFRTDIAEYRRKILSLLKDGKFDDISLSGDSFKDYVNIDPFKETVKGIADSLKAEIQEVSLMPYYKVLVNLGCKTLGDVEKIKNDYSEEAKRLALYQMGGKDIDIISSTVAVHNICVIYSLKIGLGVKGVKNIYDTLYGERPRNEISANRIIEQIKNLNIV